LLDECAAIARQQGFAPRDTAIRQIRATVTAAGSLFAASMLRDVEHGARTEAEHILGDLLRRGGDPDGYLVLRIAYGHLLSYEAQRVRTRAEVAP
jgi:2-dehydropantoate 2-reductase